MGLPLEMMSLDAFLAWENQQQERHEYYRGEVFAMVGARRIHGLVVLNLGAALKSALKGSPCRAFVESMKLQIADNAIFYPDVFVTCDPQDLRTDLIFRAPTVIVEVLSDSTQAFDRGLKFASYRRLPSLKEYLLVDPASRMVELYRRGDDGLFTLHDFTGTNTVTLAAIGCELPMTDIFDGVEGPDASA